MAPHSACAECGDDNWKYDRIEGWYCKSCGYCAPPSEADVIAKAITDVPISPNEGDSNGEEANVVDGLFAIARALKSCRGRAHGIESMNSTETYDEIPASAWRTAAEIGAATPEEIDWLWRDYLAVGTVVELDAKMKVGKSTFLGHLVRAVTEGRAFLDRETQHTPIVWMTEEGDRTFRSILARVGLADSADVHVLTRRSLGKVAWVQFVAAALDKMEQVGSRWLIVDTLPKFAGFKADEENDSATAMETMRRLQQVSTAIGACVLTTRHDRKEGGEIGDSARGSSAFGGDVDAILRLTRVGGKTPDRRKLEALGRFDETPDELTIELHKGAYRVVGESDARDAALRAICELLDQEPRIAIAEYVDELRDAGHPRATVYRAIDWGVRCGVLVQEEGESSDQTDPKSRLVSPEGGRE